MRGTLGRKLIPAQGWPALLYALENRSGLLQVDTGKRIVNVRNTQCGTTARGERDQQWQ